MISDHLVDLRAEFPDREWREVVPGGLYVGIHEYATRNIVLWKASLDCWAASLGVRSPVEASCPVDAVIAALRTAP